MGGIAPVNYNGQEVYIDASNAKEIYKAYRKGEVELDAAQQHYAEKFLSDEDIDEIEYDPEINKKEGSEKINTEGADKDETGNVAATTGGAAVSAGGAIAGFIFGASTLKKIHDAEKLTGTTGWTAAACGAVVAVLGALSIVSAKQFDNAYNERTAAKDNAGATNEIIQTQSDGLETSMEMMNEDMENYEAKNEEMSVNMNTQVGQMADLQIQLQEAQAAGNKKRVAEIQAEMAALQGLDFSEDQAELEETRAGLEEYAAYTGESYGVSESGTVVSDFLKEGNTLGVFAALNTALLGVAAIVEAVGAVKAFGSFKSIFDSIPAAIGGALWLAGMALTLTAVVTMAGKTKQEFDCGSAGNEMGDKVGELNNMIAQQEGYIEMTSETYDASDEAEGESREKGAEQAANLQPAGGPTEPKEEKPVAPEPPPPPKA